MSEIKDFFFGLFASNKWPARWHCGEWSNFHGWMYIISDLMIWLAYFTMPLIIIKYVRRKKAIVKFRRVYMLFAAFILLCGTTHFLDATMFWLPMYRLNALVRFTTGIVSLFTAYSLFKILPDAFRQKTSLELENEIARREAAELKLDEANKNLEAFVYIASHDLQEPLRKIRMYTTMLYDTETVQQDEKTKAYADKLLALSQRMQTMIKDVLTLSTLSNEVEFTTVAPARTVRDALDDLEIKIIESQAVVNIGVLPAIIGNEVYLSQLFMNLISNAIKFSKQEPVIDIYGVQNNDRVIIYIKDNGIGMNERDTTKIFQPFQRLHRRGEYEGSGIGLSICKRIAKLHNGSIRVESKPDEGTTFVVDLPAAVV